MLPAIRDAVLDALAVLLPVDCAGCGRVDRSLCAICREAVRPAVVRAELADGTAVYSGLAYRDRARRILLAFKEEGRTGLAGVLADALSAAVVVAVAATPSGDLELCVVPSSRSARRRRGYDPVRWRALNPFFGGTQAARRDPATGELSGAGDPRRGGTAVVI